MSTSQPSDPTAASADSASQGDQGNAPPAPTLRASFAIYIIAALAAGSAAAGATLSLANTFQVSRETFLLDLMSATPAQIDQAGVESRQSAIRNTILCWGVTGGLAALVFGLAAALVWKSTRGRLLGPLVGLLLGATVGASIGCTSFLLDEQLHRAGLDATVRSMIVHSLEWGLIGVVVGLAAGLASGHRSFLRRGMASSLAGGVMAGVIFSPLVMVLFPTAKPEYPLPKDDVRVLFLFMLLPTLLMAFGLARLHASKYVLANPENA